MKSLSAPYMLVIFCEEGKAELVVSLLNQHKTINLCRCMTEDDLKVQREDTQPWEGFKFDFPSQDCVIQFLSMEDKKRFIEYHRTYFSEMSNRTPRQLEFLTFRDSLRSYNLRDPSPTPSIAFPRHTTHTSMACEVSLFGLIPGESWKATRRIVISSSPAAQKRWSMSHWLPLDAVEVQENGRQVSIIWSDCDHLDKVSTECSKERTLR